jgi:Mor family transcriptional regulator
VSRISRRFRIGYDFVVRGLSVVGLARKYALTVSQIEHILRKWNGVPR